MEGTECARQFLEEDSAIWNRGTYGKRIAKLHELVGRFYLSGAFDPGLACLACLGEMPGAVAYVRIGLRGGNRNGNNQSQCDEGANDERFAQRLNDTPLVQAWKNRFGSQHALHPNGQYDDT